MLNFKILDRVVLNPESNDPTVVANVVLVNESGSAVTSPRQFQTSLVDVDGIDRQGEAWAASFDEEQAQAIASVGIAFPSDASQLVAAAQAEVVAALDAKFSAVDDVSTRLDALASTIAQRNDQVIVDIVRNVVDATAANTQRLSVLDEIKGLIDRVGNAVAVLSARVERVESVVLQNRDTTSGLSNTIKEYDAGLIAVQDDVVALRSDIEDVVLGQSKVQATVNGYVLIVKDAVARLEEKIDAKEINVAPIEALGLQVEFVSDKVSRLSADVQADYLDLISRVDGIGKKQNELAALMAPSADESA